MNYSIAVLLINPRVRLVHGIYEADEKNAPRTLFKTLDPSIKVDDYVIVPSSTRHKMTVNKIVAVDLDFDPDTTVDIKWVLGTIDRTQYEATVAMEADAVAMIKSAELREKREKLAAALIKDRDALMALPIAGNMLPPPQVPQVK